MTDVILIATIVVFFVAAALLVHVLDRMITHSGQEADLADRADQPKPGQAGSPGRELQPGRRS
jgi:hypothetical protein